jgi:predicted MFS family arabinose efflux permease
VACTYIPSISAVGEWFKVHRDLGLGLTISGIGCGTFIAAPLSAKLIEQYGWRTTFEIFGWGGAVLLLVCAALLFRPPTTGEKSRANTAKKIRTRVFALQYMALFFSGIAIYISFVFLPTYAGDIGASRAAAAGLVGYIGVSSVVGRLGLGTLAPRFGLMRLYLVSYLILLISFGVWLMSGSYPILVIFALLMGVGYGGIAAMAPAVAAVTFGIDGLGELLGILFTGLGAACLAGPPAAGILVDHFHDYRLPVYIGTGASVLALLCGILLQDHRRRI